MPFLTPHFDTEGPFGLPMKSKQASALEARLKDLPQDDAHALRRLPLTRGLSELSPESRCDVSWITEEAPDRLGDIVLSAGMDDSHFQQNPIVTLNHQYDQPPVGRSLWRRKVKEGSLTGVKAKTHYPPRPDSWSGDWQPDFAFELVKSGLLCGKSIGFIPLKMRTPTAAEIQQDPTLKSVRFIIETWLLAEYACCYLPLQPNSVVEQVTKSLQLTNPPRPFLAPPTPKADENSPPERPLPFLTLAEITRSMRSQNLSDSLEKTLLLTWKRTLGL